MDLCGLVESVVAAEDSRYPASKGLVQPPGGKGGFWISSGLFPQLIAVQLSCAVCLERVVLEGTGIKRVRIECERASEEGGGPTTSHNVDWGDLMTSDMELEPELSCPMALQVNEIRVPSIFTWRVLISVEGGEDDDTFLLLLIESSFFDAFSVSPCVVCRIPRVCHTY